MQQAEAQKDNSLEELLQLADLYGDQMRQLAEERQAETDDPKKELVLWTAIAGIQHHVDVNSKAGQRLLNRLKPGTLLSLRREPENSYDPWAIAVYADKKTKLGYITRFKNETIARMMDHGHQFEARVEPPLEVAKYDEEYQKNFRSPTEQFLLSFSVWLIK